MRTFGRKGKRRGRQRGERLRRGFGVAGEGDMRRKRSGIDAQPALGAVGNQRVVERIERGNALDAQNQDGVVRLAEIVGNLQRKRRGGKSGSESLIA